MMKIMKIITAPFRRLYLLVPDSSVPRMYLFSWMTMFFIGVVGSLYVWLASSIPFGQHNYVIHDYKAMPDQGCVNSFTSTVTLGVDRTITYPWKGRLKALRVESYWQTIDGLQRTEVQRFPLQSSDYATKPGRNTYDSPNVRSAPPDIGNWRLVNEVTLYGSVLGVSRVASFVDVSEEVFKMLPETDPKCYLEGNSMFLPTYNFPLLRLTTFFSD